MNVRELYLALEERIPRALSCEWDNDGLMCCPDSSREVGKVLIALDATAEVVDAAIEGGYDVIVTHHPFVFKGIKSLDDAGGVSAKAISLIRKGISVMSFHTRLDAADGGVNDTLCALLGIKNVAPIFEENIPLGRVGELDSSIDVNEFARKIKEVLGAPFVLLSDAGIPAHRIAVLGGGGKDFVGVASACGADTFVSGRLDYHPMTDTPDSPHPINLIEAGHFHTENPVCEALAQMVNAIDSSIICDIFNSNVIKAI